MTTEEKVEHLENKLYEILEFIKFMIQVDDGINAKNANIILSNLDKLQEDRL